jgi:hypothetical protein
MSVISASVGRNGVNQKGDTQLIQLLLNDWLSRKKKTLLTVDGICGNKTIAAIGEFQKTLGYSDHRCDPGGNTLKALTSGVLGNINSQINTSNFAGMEAALSSHLKANFNQQTFDQELANIWGLFRKV